MGEEEVNTDSGLTPSEKRQFLSLAFYPHSEAACDFAGLFAQSDDVAEATAREAASTLTGLMNHPSSDIVFRLAEQYADTYEALRTGAVVPGDEPLVDHLSSFAFALLRTLRTAEVVFGVETKEG
jgi:hypothetical protein